MLLCNHVIAVIPACDAVFPGASDPIQDVAQEWLQTAQGVYVFWQINHFVMTYKPC